MSFGNCQLTSMMSTVLQWSSLFYLRINLFFGPVPFTVSREVYLSHHRDHLPWSLYNASCAADGVGVGVKTGRMHQTWQVCLSAFPKPRYLAEKY
jgi:hypothetical protein